MKVKLLSRVRLSDPMDCSLPGSSVHGIFQARVVEWGATAFSALIVQLVKNPPAMQETQKIWVLTLGQEDPLEKGMATHASILTGKSHGQRSLVGCSPWGC